MLHNVLEKDFLGLALYCACVLKVKVQILNYGNWYFHTIWFHLVEMTALFIHSPPPLFQGTINVFCMPLINQIY